MAIKNENHESQADGRLNRTPGGEAVVDSPAGRALPAGKKADGFMGTEEALATEVMLRTAMEAISCDSQVLKQTMEKDLDQSALKTKRRLDWRLMIWAVGLVFVILVIDLLVQTF